MAMKMRGTIGKARQLRYAAAATTSLAALMIADPAWADCATTTAGGTVTLSCGDTATTNTTNNDPNNPSTTAYRQLFGDPIVVIINSGTTITGAGLFIDQSLNGPVTFTNNGTVSNTATGTASPSNGIQISGNGGLITYLGSGNATSSVQQGANGLFIANRNGGIALGSPSAPVSGTFRGGTGGMDLRTSSSGALNAWINGGSIIDDQGQIAIALSIAGNINLIMTGHSALKGSLAASIASGTPAGPTITVTTDAQIDATQSILSPAISLRGSGGAVLNLTSGAAVTQQVQGVDLGSSTGEVRLTTAAGTTIRTTSTSGYGVRLSHAGNATATVDLNGSIDSAATGLLTLGDAGATSITIREGASVSGGNIGLSTRGTTNPATVLTLGTIAPPASRPRLPVRCASATAEPAAPSRATWSMTGS